MIRSALRTLLRRQLQEATVDNWADADLNTLIDAGYDRVGTKFFAGNPERAPLAAPLLISFTRDGDGQTCVALLSTLALGLTRIADVSLLQSDGTYKQIPKRTRGEVEGAIVGDDACWCWLGANVLVAPAPAVALANGIRFRYWGGLALAADGDSPSLPSSLHLAIVYEAKAIALGETGEDDTPTNRMLSRIYAETAGAFPEGGGEPESWALDRRSSTEY